MCSRSWDWTIPLSVWRACFVLEVEIQHRHSPHKVPQRSTSEKVRVVTSYLATYCNTRISPSKSINVSGSIWWFRSGEPSKGIAAPTSTISASVLLGSMFYLKYYTPLSNISPTPMVIEQSYVNCWTYLPPSSTVSGTGGSDTALSSRIAISEWFCQFKIGLVYVPSWTDWNSGLTQELVPRWSCRRSLMGWIRSL